MTYHSALWSLDNWGKLHMERLNYKDIWDETKVKLPLTTALHHGNKLCCHVDKMQRERPAKLMVKYVDQLQQQEAWANSTAAWQLNCVINSLNLYVGRLSTDIFLVCCLFHDVVSSSVCIASTVGSLCEWWIRFYVEDLERKTTMNFRIADVPVGIWTGYPPNVSATPAGLFSRCGINCSRK